MAQPLPLDQNAQSMLRIFIAATAQLPKFRGERGELFRSFETSFRIKFHNVGLNHFALDEQKRALLGCLEGKAARAHILLAANTPAYQNAGDIEAFLTELRNIFQPPAESELSRIEFENLRQSAREPITVYHAAKMAAYSQAVPNPGPNHFSYLKQQMIKGIYNSYVKQKTIEAAVQNEAQLLQVMVAASAHAMEAYSLDTGYISNLDGLAATTSFEHRHHYDEVEDMEIGKVGDGKCYYCDCHGHIAKDCPKRKQDRRNKDTKKEGATSRDNTVICAFCDHPGHHVSVCRKKKQYKEDQAKASAAKRKVKKTTAEEEDLSEMYEDDDEEGDEEVEEVANEEFLEEGPVNTIKDLDFPKQSCTPRDKVYGRKHH